MGNKRQHLHRNAGNTRQPRVRRSAKISKILPTHGELKARCNEARKILESIIHETCRRRSGDLGQLETPIAQALTEYGAEVRGKVRIRKVCQGVMNAVITVLFRIQKGLKRVAISLNVRLLEQPLRA